MSADVPRETAAKTVLTNREREVVRLICDGLSDKEIAAEMRISPKTVGSFKRDVFRKAGVHKVTALVRWAIRTGRIEA